MRFSCTGAANQLGERPSPAGRDGSNSRRTNVNQRPYVRAGLASRSGRCADGKRARLVALPSSGGLSSSIPSQRRCRAKLRQEMSHPGWFHISFFLRGACVKGIRICDTWKDQARRARTAQMVSPLPERSRCYQSGPKGEGSSSLPLARIYLDLRLRAMLARSRRTTSRDGKFQ